jgi:hypothetical protein
MKAYEISKGAPFQHFRLLKEMEAFYGIDEKRANAANFADQRRSGKAWPRISRTSANKNAAKPACALSGLFQEHATLRVEQPLERFGA